MRSDVVIVVVEARSRGRKARLDESRAKVLSARTWGVCVYESVGVGARGTDSDCG